MKRLLYITEILLLTLNNFSQVSFSGCYISGAMTDPGSTAGCGNGVNYCNLASLYVPAFTPVACGTVATSGGVAYSRSTSYSIPAGCTATVVAEYKKRNYFGAPVNPSGVGCSNCGMDGSPDGFQITQAGGVVASQSSTIDVNVGTCALYPTLGVYTTAVASLSPGCNNADGTLKMIVTGGVVTIGGTSNRADEIMTYTINLSGTCGPSCGGVLPIELILFKGQILSDKVNIEWSVASEKNVNYYLIEKSYDGIVWEKLSAIYANNTVYGTNQSYQTTDYYPSRGTNYYRLSSFDNNSSIGEGKIIVVNFDGNAKATWVDQSESNINIHFNSQYINERVRLFDAQGNMVKEALLDDVANVTTISKVNLQKGFYFLKSSNGLKALNLKLILN